MQTDISNQAPAPQPTRVFLETAINLRQYWHIIMERRWLVITTFLTVMLLTAIYLFRATKIYEAEVRMQIDREGVNPLQVKDVVSMDSREQDYLQTQYKNLESRSLLETVIRDLNLDKDARYAKQADPVLALAGDIVIAPVRMSRLVYVRVQHSNPKTAQLIANTLATNFIKRNIEQKLSSTTDAVDWLQEQVREARDLVSRAEEDLFEYRKSHSGLSFADGEDILRQSLIQTQANLDRARTEAAQNARAVAEIEFMVNNGEPIDTIPSIAQNQAVQRLQQEIAVEEANLAALLKRYRDKYPTVIAARNKIEALHRSLAQECENQLLVLKNNATLLKKQQNELEGMLTRELEKQLELVSARIDYDNMRREAENNKAIHNNVIMRLKETELMGRLTSNNMRVVDPAVEPNRPVKPRMMIMFLLGCVAATGLSLGLAFFVSYLDDSIKSQEDVENFLRVPFLGYIPNIKTNSVVERDLQVHLHPQSNAAEGFRTIRAAVMLAHRADKFRVISVTSTIPSEGKSLVASNLAIVHAQTGSRTLLVDADLRRPSVHKAYQLHSPVGLSAFLSKETDRFEDFVHKTEVPNLDVVCCGAIPQNPSELVGSARMLEFLRRARDRYDRVVLDCPPVSAVSDPLVISAMSDGVIYVAKFNKIRREHARKSVQRIQNAGIYVIGGVINDIDFEGKDSYYYQYYYYQNRYYASHYKNDPDAPAKPDAKPEPKTLAKV